MTDSDIPVHVDGDETIIRAIKTPDHHKNKQPSQLKPYAFKPRMGFDDLSVMRHMYLGTDGCRDKAKGFFAGKYIGLAAIKASAVRSAGSDVIDTREVFLGHADMPHGFILTPDEPLPAEQALLLKNRLDALVAAAVMYVDPDCESATWTGDTIG